MTPIRYRTDLEGVSPDELTGFFVGWPSAPDPATHLRLLDNSYAFVLAVDAETERIVGFVNAVSDGVLSAYIPLLEVLPDWQGRGIGTELVERICAQLDDLYMVDLACDPELESFYEPLGFEATTAMIRRNYDHQSGRPAQDED